LAADRSAPAGRIAILGIIVGSGRKIFKAIRKVAEMTGKQRSRSVVPASSAASKTLIASGARLPAPKLPKLRVQKNSGLEEALLKIAEIWQDVHARRRRRRHRTQTN